MTNYGPYIAFDIEFDTGGHPVDPTQLEDALAFLGNGGEGAGVGSIFVISHGWNNDIAEAQQLYHDFFDAYGTVAATLGKAPKDYAVLAIFWPSKKFADSALIPGGAAGYSDPIDAQLNAQLDLFKSMFADNPKAASNVEAARKLLPTLSINVSGQDQYVSLLAELVPNARYEADEGLDEAVQTIGNLQGRTVLKRLSQPVRPVGTSATAGFNIGDAIKNAAASFGNVLTYYTMKDRSGIVGQTGGAALVQELRAKLSPALKIHLVGHSFGGRLVTSLANALPAAITVDSMTLLEAAYSHNGLATNWDGAGAAGAFQAVLTRPAIRGPVLITHSAHDIPVGIMYPTASRLMNQVAASVYGGPDDKFGGMGRNGAQHTPQVAVDVPLGAVGAHYPPPPATVPYVVNISGDGPVPEITGHGDVCKPEIASAMLSYGIG